MSPITSHVLDLALGRPAADLALRLERLEDDGHFRLLASCATDQDGRARELLPERALEARTYRIVFETGAYFAATGRAAFYPRVEVVFAVSAVHEHHHIPLLLSPFGYSTYRGS